ncbi:HlyD family type I secretion periplasmic adaptor subunit [Erwinia sp. CPCC 100877]|nr:HlyD family type I secretion periplasmic adaptor subunit [Erwinia sp. CPCC 100877]
MKKLLSRTKKKTINNSDVEFMNDIRASLLSQSTPKSRAIIFLIVTVIGVGALWAHYARVEEITKGDAKIISRGREQIIQSLEGGILAEMNVKEGSVVNRGDVLLKIDPTRAQSSYREALSKIISLRASISRLRAEAYSQPLVFDPDIIESPEVIKQEQKAYESRKHALEESVASLRKSYELSMKEIHLAEPLASRGLLSEVELLRMRRQANDILSQIVERKNRYISDAQTELEKLELELRQTKENLVGRADVMERTTITAPVHGTVKNIRINTIGGVIQPGEDILEIIPLEDQLLVEGKIRPSDVAFLRPGLPAMVKISAYDFAIYGGLKGVVEYISPDTLEDDKKNQVGKSDNTYYRVMILTDKSSLSYGGKEMPIIPGMIATIEIRTGEKTILDYLLKPIMKSKEAFRER